MTSTAATNVRTAAQYREEARDCGRREQESWERSDTDGFLSQWAMQQMQGTYLANANTVEAGGLRICVLVELATGNIIGTPESYREGQYGWYYLVGDEAAARVGRFVSTSNATNDATRERNNAKKGVAERMVLVPLAHCFEGASGRIEYDWDYVKALVGTTGPAE